MGPALGNDVQGRMESLLAIEVIATAGICLWLLSNAVMHLVDYFRARQAVRAFVNTQPAATDPTIPTPLEMRRAAFPPLLSLVLLLNVVLQVIVAIPFAVATFDFISGRPAVGVRWASYAFAGFAALWTLFLFADPWVHWAPRNALERQRLLLIVCGILGFALFQQGV
jgi:hypothetical protein